MFRTSVDGDASGEGVVGPDGTGRAGGVDRNRPLPTLPTLPTAPPAVPIVTSGGLSDEEGARSRSKRRTFIAPLPPPPLASPSSTSDVESMDEPESPACCCGGCSGGVGCASRAIGSADTSVTAAATAGVGGATVVEAWGWVGCDWSEGRWVAGGERAARSCGRRTAVCCGAPPPVMRAATNALDGAVPPPVNVRTNRTAPLSPLAVLTAGDSAGEGEGEAHPPLPPTPAVPPGIGSNNGETTNELLEAGGETRERPPFVAARVVESTDDALRSIETSGESDRGSFG